MSAEQLFRTDPNVSSWFSFIDGPSFSYARLKYSFGRSLGESGNSVINSNAHLAEASGTSVSLMPSKWANHSFPFSSGSPLAT